jgi:hypothetical protein
MKGKNIYYLLTLTVITVFLLGGFWLAKKKGLLNSSLVGDTERINLSSPTNGQLDQNGKEVAVEGTTGAKGTEKTLSLVISSPTDGSTVTSATTAIKGKTAPYAEVFVNETETKADKLGDFSVNLTLDQGENTIVVSANDQDGNFVEKEIKITL